MVTVIKAKLDEPDLRCLMRMGELTIKRLDDIEIKLILADIGFSKMQHCLCDAIDGVDQSKNHIQLDIDHAPVKL